MIFCDHSQLKDVAILKEVEHGLLHPVDFHRAEGSAALYVLRVPGIEHFFLLQTLYISEDFVNVRRVRGKH